MEFNNVKDLILHSFQSPIPVDVKIGDEFASMKIYRDGCVNMKKYVPEKVYDIDVSSLGDCSEMTIDNYLSKEVGKTLGQNESVVAVLNSRVCTIRKIGIHTTVIFYIKPKYEFVSGVDVLDVIKKETLLISKDAGNKH